MARSCYSENREWFSWKEAGLREKRRRPALSDSEIYWRLAGGTMLFILKYSTSCP
jgi:hypothetical protein